MLKSQISKTHEGVTIGKTSFPRFLIAVTEKGNSFIGEFTQTHKYSLKQSVPFCTSNFVILFHFVIFVILFHSFNISCEDNLNTWHMTCAVKQLS